MPITVVEAISDGQVEAFLPLTITPTEPILAGDLLLMDAKLNGIIGGGDATITSGLGLPWTTLHTVNSRGIWYCVAPENTSPGQMILSISGYNRSVCYVNLRGVPSFDVGVSDFYPSTTTDPLTVDVGTQVLSMDGTPNNGVIGGVLIPSGASSLTGALQIVLVPGWGDDGGSNPDPSWTPYVMVFDQLGIFFKGSYAPPPSSGCTEAQIIADWARFH